jgi:hypothetical protein
MKNFAYLCIKQMGKKFPRLCKQKKDKKTFKNACTIQKLCLPLHQDKTVGSKYKTHGKVDNRGLPRGSNPHRTRKVVSTWNELSDTLERQGFFLNFFRLGIAYIKNFAYLCIKIKTFPNH